MVKPNPEVIKAFARKAKMLSENAEKMARYGREWLDDDYHLNMLWAVSKSLYQLSETLSKK